MQQRTTLPETGFARLSAILAVIPVSKSTFWEKVRTGGFPNPVKRRALDGQHPHSPAEIGSWFEQTAQRWNERPTPFVWNGKRGQRRRRSGGDQTHRLGGSGACTHRPLRQNRATGASE